MCLRDSRGCRIDIWIPSLERFFVSYITLFFYSVFEIFENKRTYVCVSFRTKHRLIAPLRPTKPQQTRVIAGRTAAGRCSVVLFAHFTSVVIC